MKYQNLRILWILLLCLAHNASWTSSYFSQDTWPIDPLFGADWYNIGLSSPSFEQHHVPEIAHDDDTPPSPRFEQHDIPEIAHDDDTPPSPRFEQYHVPESAHDDNAPPSPRFEQYHVPESAYDDDTLPSPRFEQYHVPESAHGDNAPPSPSFAQYYVPDGDHGHVPAQQPPFLHDDAPLRLTQATALHGTEVLPVITRVKYEPSTRANGRKFMGADVAKRAYDESLVLFENGTPSDFAIAQHNFLMCYRYSTIHRWTGCLQLAKISLKMAHTPEAYALLMRIVESTSSPIAMKQEAQALINQLRGRH